VFYLVLGVMRVHVHVTDGVFHAVGRSGELWTIAGWECTAANRVAFWSLACCLNVYHVLFPRLPSVVRSGPEPCRACCVLDEVRGSGCRMASKAIVTGMR
jgi:hypothetical protein